MEKIVPEVLKQTVVTVDGKRSLKTDFKAISMTPVSIEMSEEDIMASHAGNRAELDRLEGEIQRMTAKKDKLAAVVTAQEADLAKIRK